MALSLREQAKYWSIAAIGLLVMLWFLANIMLPFVAGLALAYFLDPIATRLTKLGLSRLIATSIILLLMGFLLVLAILLIVPNVVAQASQLVEIAPDIFLRLQAYLTAQFPDLLNANSLLRQNIAGFGETVRDQAIALANTLLQSVTGVVSAAVFLTVTPVVTFYMLIDWPRLMQTVNGYLPREHAGAIRGLAKDIDRAIAGFVRGQVTVCLILAAYYAVALGLAGLNFGLVVGVLAGLLSFIPYVGAIFGGIMALGLALFQFWGDPVSIAIVGAVFVTGQVFEGNFLVPNLVGRSVGLHPVWLLFALAAFGSLFGFTGLLVAVPLAASLGVLVRFGLGRYKESLLYRGRDPEDKA
jgi:predicted PurR-regulated permease PerM